MIWQNGTPFRPPSTKHQALSEWLTDNCINAGNSEDSCKSRLADGNVVAFYQRHQLAGLKRWNSYFDITTHRNDLDWTSAHETQMNVQWTIRHEFGHVLGFPNCYLEFYDNDTATMVSYQLDVTNLMCSRRPDIGQGY